MRTALVGIGLLAAVGAAALSQEGPPPSVDGSGLVLVYAVVDLEANSNSAPASTKTTGW